jgi:hypothetical protein
LTAKTTNKLPSIAIRRLLPNLLHEKAETENPFNNDTPSQSSSSLEQTFVNNLLRLQENPKIIPFEEHLNPHAFSLSLFQFTEFYVRSSSSFFSFLFQISCQHHQHRIKFYFPLISSSDVACFVLFLLKRLN